MFAFVEDAVCGQERDELEPVFIKIPHPRTGNIIIHNTFIDRAENRPVDWVSSQTTRKHLKRQWQIYTVNAVNKSKSTSSTPTKATPRFP